MLYISTSGQFGGQDSGGPDGGPEVEDVSSPVAGTSPVVGGGSSGGLLLACAGGGPVAGLGLGGPILGHLVPGSSRGSDGCRSWGSSSLTVSRPVLHASLSAPVLLLRSREVASLHHLGLSVLSPLLLLLLGLLGVPVEEEVGHDLPRSATADGSPESEHLPGEHPPHQTDAMRALVVAGDSDVDELGGRVNVAEGDDGDVGVAALSDGLVIGPGVADDQQPGLAEGGLDLVSEGSGSEPSGHGGAVDVPGELEDSPLGVGSAGADVHILGVLNRGDGTGSEQDLLPGLLQVDDVDPVVLLLEDVLLHGLLAVVRANVGGCGQHLGDIILGDSKA